MVTANEIEELLNEVKREQDKEKEQEQIQRDQARDDGRRSDRHRERERYGRYDRSRTRSRDRYRELNNNEDRASQSSRDQDKDRATRRRDGSRTRSNRDADADEDRDSRYRRRSTSRDRFRRRDRGGGDFYNGRGRSRSRSPRGRDDRRGFRERSRERHYDDRRGGGRRRSPTPPATEDDRDKRTVFVQQISQRALQRHVRQFFETVGGVVDAQIVKDRVTGRSKGVGYVEFKEFESVSKALELTGQKLKGVPVIVQLTEAEKNRASRATATAEGGATTANNGHPFHRLFVGNIHFSVTEEDIKTVFEPFGEIEALHLQKDEKIKTRSKGYGWVQYIDPEHAKVALKELNGFEIAGRQIRVGLGNDKFTPESTAHLLRNFPAQAANYQGSAFSGAGGRGAYAGGSGGVYDRTNGRDDRGVTSASALDDTDMSGVNFKQVDRNKLMANLARNEVDVPVPRSMQPAARSRAAPVNDPPPSRHVKISGLFDADEEFKENGANWVKELEKEVYYECKARYGEVVHISVDADSDGDVYLKFAEVAGGKTAYQGLNGRRFNSRAVRASYVVDKIYDSLFGVGAVSKF